MEPMIQQVLDDSSLFLPLLIAVSILTGAFIKSVTRVLTTNARERTRREIAAYIAEGSMTPEQAERLLKAGNEDMRRAC